ncbi:uncharacterized protein [Prorops nasuta]|uniref:uncharacterized protein n=1 Tax=Prorops nasuta TaxID=863751 RepID=UPI0034CD08A3
MDMVGEEEEEEGVLARARSTLGLGVARVCIVSASGRFARRSSLGSCPARGELFLNRKSERAPYPVTLGPAIFAFRTHESCERVVQRALEKEPRLESRSGRSHLFHDARLCLTACVLYMPVRACVHACACLSVRTTTTTTTTTTTKTTTTTTRTRDRGKWSALPTGGPSSSSPFHSPRSADRAARNA